MGTLQDKVIWVTGSARRVGRSIALEAARAGADIVVHCRTSREEGERTVEEIVALGRRAILVQGNHASRHDAWEMMREIDRTFGRLDGLVNSAAIFPRKAFPDVMEDDFDEAINANLRGPFLCSQVALPLLRRNAPSHIVNVLDSMVHRPYGQYSAYWCAKGGLYALTRALAKELAPDVLVNGVAPGPVLPPEDADAEHREIAIRRTLLQRWGEPEDVARAVLFLLQSDYVTGVILPVDGGRSIA